MDALPTFVTDSALALVALLWLGSVILLVFAVRGWFVARAKSRLRPAGASSSALASTGEAPASTEWYVGSQALTDVGDVAAIDGHADIPLANPGHGPLTAEDQQPAPSTTAAVAATAVPREALAATVRTRVAHRDASSRALADLVRALYLDQSNFRFETLCALSAQDRALARHLVDTWLADPSAVDFWQALYAAVDTTSATARASQDA